MYSFIPYTCKACGTMFNYRNLQCPLCSAIISQQDRERGFAEDRIELVHVPREPSK